jgi:hypothetical protein
MLISRVSRFIWTITKNLLIQRSIYYNKICVISPINLKRKIFVKWPIKLPKFPHFFVKFFVLFLFLFIFLLFKIFFKNRHLSRIERTHDLLSILKCFISWQLCNFSGIFFFPFFLRHWFATIFKLDLFVKSINLMRSKIDKNSIYPIAYLRIRNKALNPCLSCLIESTTPFLLISEIRLVFVNNLVFLAIIANRWYSFCWLIYFVILIPRYSKHSFIIYWRVWFIDWLILNLLILLLLCSSLSFSFRFFVPHVV